jgi:hypothetical protein
MHIIFYDFKQEQESSGDLIGLILDDDLIPYDAKVAHKLAVS